MSAASIEARDRRPPPVLERACYECHADGEKKGSFALDELLGKGTGPDHRGAWLKVWKNVRHEFMPPSHALEEVTADERRAIARWIEEEVFAVDPKRPDPGVVTIRRLNREEYQHTINDLFGTDFELKEQLLPDDSAHGFDNIGEAQTLSPVQFLRYLDLAEWIVGQTVVDGGPPRPRVTFDARGPKSSRALSRKSLTATNGVVEKRFPIVLSHDGDYRLELTVGIGGWQDYGGDTRITVHVDDQPIGECVLPFGGEVTESRTWDFSGTQGPHTVVFHAALLSKPLAALGDSAEPDNVVRARDAAAPPRRPDPEQLAQRAEARRIFEEEFGAEAGRDRPRGAPPPTPELKFQQLAISVIGPFDPNIVGEYPESHRKIFFRGASPTDPVARRAYATDILRRIADRAFHRPVDAPTLERLVSLALKDENFERGIGSALTAVLTSPRFLFRDESPAATHHGTEHELLDEHALATRLSYLLWVSIPDDELQALAATGRLRANLSAQL